VAGHIENQPVYHNLFPLQLCFLQIYIFSRLNYIYALNFNLFVIPAAYYRGQNLPGSIIYKP